MGDTGAFAKIEISPPPRMAVGRGNAFVVAGHAYAAAAPTRQLSIRIGDRAAQRADEYRLPRDDVYGDLPETDPARAHAYRSGFVSVVRLHPITRAERSEIELILALDGGGAARATVGEIELTPAIAPPEGFDSPKFTGDSQRVAICMATYEPPPSLLRAQLESIRAQTHPDWICVISDDNSSPRAFERLLALTEADRRFVVSRSPVRLGFYRNFERALSMAPPDADFVTLCDQDDSWYPHKLERLVGGIGDAQLAYSDARIVTPEGEIVRPSYWTERSNNHSNFASLLLANTVTGAASLYRRDLLEDALPFPPRIARGFHDHWLALVAMARGDLAYIDEPLYDYVQHGAAVIGHLGANKRPRQLRRHLIERLRNPTGGSRVAYFYDWQQQRLFWEVLRMRCWPRMSPRKRRTAARLLRADRSLAALSWMLALRVRRLWGHDETLDRELYFGHAVARRRAVSLLTAGRRRPSRFLSRDVSVPPSPYDAQ